MTGAELAILTRVPSDSYAGYEVVPLSRFGVQGLATEISSVESVDLGEIIDFGVPTGDRLQLPAAAIPRV